MRCEPTSEAPCRRQKRKFMDVVHDRLDGGCSASGAQVSDALKQVIEKAT